MKKILLISVSLIILITITQIYFSMANETKTQPYQVLKNEKNYEIRYYPPAMLATVTMAAKSYKELATPGFKKLASFIFGGNQSNKNIAMTTPVHMNINDSQSSMSFVMTSDYTRANLPLPNDSSITIETTAAEYVAAIEFGGYADDAAIKKNVAKLESALKSSGVDYFGPFRFLGYNAPYQFWRRRNEIIVSVHWD